MIGTLRTVAIGDERGETISSDETQGCDRVARGRSGTIREVKRPKSHRGWIGFEQFDKIMARRELSARQPLIDFQGAVTAERDRHIGGAEAWSAKAPGAI